MARPTSGVRRPRRRDRRGRGLRGPLAPAAVPLSLTRSEQFEELVAASLGRLRVRWAQALESIDVEVEDVPDPDAGAGSARLGRAEEAVGGRPARIVVYRRAVEARARGQRSREALVHEVVVAALADLLGLDPATVDPDSED